MYEKAMEILRWLGDQIGEGAEYFWPIIVRQQWIEVVSWLLFPLVVIGTWLVINKMTDKIQDNEAKTGAKIAVHLLGTLALLIFIGIFCTYLPQLFNPEYYAMKEVLDIIKP